LTREPPSYDLRSERRNARPDEGREKAKAVLGRGSLPLAVLERLLDGFVEREKAR
jgi:uncharacterized protein (DUF885 family)